MSRPRDLVSRPLLLAVLALAACGTPKVEGPTREAVLPALQQEAQSLKTGGEKIDPALMVRVTWNIESVEASERPNDAAHPWAGLIRFRIETRSREVDGSTRTDTLEKKFAYLYDAGLKRWLIQ